MSNDIILFPVPNGAGQNDIQLPVAGAGTVARFNQVGVEVWQPNDTVIGSTEARFHQVGLEVWERMNPEARFRQVGLEVWMPTDAINRRLVNVYFL